MVNAMHRYNDYPCEDVCPDEGPCSESDIRSNLIRDLHSTSVRYDGPYTTVQRCCLERYLKMTNDPVDELCELLKNANAKITFSKNCRSGYLERDVCECWRCKEDRNEPVTAESEDLASRIAHELDLMR